MKSEGSQEFIRIRDQFIGEIEKYNCDEIGLNKYENHEFKKRLWSELRDCEIQG